MKQRELNDLGLGPAFPTDQEAQYNDTMGMTLRDYFAGQALASLATAHHGKAFDEVGTAKSAYEFADAMLEARKDTPND